MTDVFNGLVHRPVLYHEIIHLMQPIRGGLYVDCTLGAGGHAWGILEASSPDGLILGLDVDPQALDLAWERLAHYGSRAIIRQASYETLRDQLKSLGWQAVDGVLLDLGVSSMQLDTAERGFSFIADAPLDMRFNQESSLRAHDLVNGLSESELAGLLYRYGEERRARQIARAIVQARPLSTTRQLADIVVRTVGKGWSSQSKSKVNKTRIHPATRTFQALRIAVNRELEALDNVLPQALEALKHGGRLAVISFHSLEDRLVKGFIRREASDCLCPPRTPVCICGHRAALIEVTRKPLRPGEDEINRNPRSRSARLRVAEKIINDDSESGTQIANYEH